MRSHLVVTLAFVTLPLIACNPKVFVNGGEDSPCGDPPANVGGYCPPAWECIDGEWVDTAGACPTPECPLAEPANGDPCPVVGQTCEYDVDVPCGDWMSETVVCTESGWSGATNFCMPEPICPEALPVAGSDCSGWVDAYYCQYPVTSACGESWVGVLCDTASYEWVVTQPAVSCDCGGLPADQCGVTDGCQWLEPGCGESPITAGCYAQSDCTQPGFECDADTQCVAKSFNPCFGELCDGCAATFSVCEPVLGGG